MEELSPDALSDALRAEPRKRLARLLTSSTLLVVSLYVLGFIYLKTYLAAFGLQIELASLSLPNLVLAHRFFVSQHFFVAAGALHAFLFTRFGLRGMKQHPFAAGLIAFSPLGLPPFGWVLSAWSEQGTPVGFNIKVPQLWIPFLVGWIMGGACFLVARRALKELESLRQALWYVGAILVVALTVFSYRLYAAVTAADRIQRNDFQSVSYLAIGDDGVLGPCHVVYVDSEMFYLLCGPKADRKEIVRKDSVDRYVLE